MSWDNFRFVLEAARSKSLAQASKRLHVNQSTVLRRVVSFQEKYGVRLFDSRQKGYRLNNLGHELLKDLVQIEQDFNDIIRQQLDKSGTLSGTLRLTAPDILFDTFLIPALSEFRTLFPGITIVAIQSYQTLSLTKWEVDVAIRMTNKPGLDLIGKRLGEVLFGIYLKTGNQPPDLAGEHANNWVGLADHMSHLREAHWLHKNYPDANYTIQVDSLLSAVSAIRADFGKALLPCFVGDTLDELARLGEPVSGIDGELWLLYHKNSRRNPKVVALGKFLQTKFSENDTFV